MHQNYEYTLAIPADPNCMQAAPYPRTAGPVMPYPEREEPAKPASPVCDALHHLRDRQEVTNAMLSDLRRCLDFVLRPHEDGGEKAGGAYPVHSELHGVLISAGHSQDDINDQLRSLISRITL